MNKRFAGSSLMLAVMDASDQHPDHDDDIEESWSLGAQLPVIPPDETPGVLGKRELDPEELVQAQADVALLENLAPVTPYARAADALSALETLVDELAERVGGAGGPLSRRGQRQVRRAFANVARTLGTLPEEFSASLWERFGGESEAARRLAEEQAHLSALPPYRLACALERVPVERVVVVAGDEINDLVLPAQGVAEWSEAAGEAAGGPLVLVSLAASALVEAQRLVSRWLLEHAELIREASLRLQALAAEVIEGYPVLLRVRLRRRPGEEPEILDMQPTPLPLEQLRGLQEGLLRAERLLDTQPSEPALRGPAGMPAERILAVAGGAVDEGDSVVSEPGSAPAPEGLDNEAATDSEDDEPMPPALDLPAVMAHLELGVISLERAWSRALAEEEVEALVGQWSSLIEALRSEMFRADRDLPEDERYLDEFSVPPEEIARLGLGSEGGQDAARHERLAQLTALTALVQLVPALSEPTLRLKVEGRDRHIEWLSSGAFAALRDRQALLRELLGGAAGETPEGWRQSVRRAFAAELRADPEAVILHLARAFALHPADDATCARNLSAAEQSVLNKVREAATRLAAGEAPGQAPLVLLADAALHLAEQVLVPVPEDEESAE